MEAQLTSYLELRYYIMKVEHELTPITLLLYGFKGDSDGEDTIHGSTFYEIFGARKSLYFPRSTQEADFKGIGNVTFHPSFVLEVPNGA